LGNCKENEMFYDSKLVLSKQEICSIMIFVLCFSTMVIIAIKLENSHNKTCLFAPRTSSASPRVRSGTLRRRFLALMQIVCASANNLRFLVRIFKFNDYKIYISEGNI